MKVYDDQFIVVTGAAGFIGSAVVRHLNDLGYDNLLLVDHLGHGEKWKNLVGKKFADIIEKDQLFNWLNGKENRVEAFIHLGACSSTTETDASYLLENNYRYTVNLAQYALKNDKKFIYASSAATYGDGFEGFNDSEETLDRLRPLNMYGYSKHLFDLWARNEGVSDRLVGLKYFNVFGPNEYHKGRMASVVLHWVPQVQKEGVIRLFKSSELALFKDGDQKRDFIYVKDAARMTCAFLFNDAAGIYNIGRGRAETWNTVANAVFSALGQTPKIEYIDMPSDLIGKYQNFTQANMLKTQQVLGDKTKTAPLEESIIDYVRNYLLAGQRW